MTGFEPIGLLTTVRPVAEWALREAIKRLPPDTLADPVGAVRRVGDLLVWQGEKGQTVLSAIESFGETQQRIDGAVAQIEVAQVATSSTLHVVQSLSMATLGVTSLSAGFMIWRLNALNTRLKLIADQLADIQMAIEAGQLAQLQVALQSLDTFENQGGGGHLQNATQNAHLMTNTYGNLIDNECAGRRRMPVLNYRGRLYLLALMAEAQCWMLQEQPTQMKSRIAIEQPRLKKLIEVTFHQTVGKAPEMYLHPALGKSGATLALMTELYQQLQQAGVLKDADVRDASEMFERFREAIYRPGIFGRLWQPSGRATRAFADNLRYLVSCVEDVNRIDSLRLVNEGLKSMSFADLRARLREWRREIGEAATGGQHWYAYRFA